MGMHQGLDLSKFKKVASDAKTSTLRHSKGHEIRISHAGLTPKMREALKNLPVYAAEGVDVEPMDDASPEETADASSPAEAPVEAAPAPGEAPATGGAAPEAPASAPANPGLPPKPAVMPVAGTVDVVGQKPAEPAAEPEEVDPAQELNQEALAWNEDLKNQHITPHTYADLFAKKDTLGKVGTLFGLLLSGAGSGLAHQPNMVMQMMDKELANDFEAQKQSKGNAQNFLKISQQNELNKSMIDLQHKQGLLTDEQAESMKADVGLKSTTTALNMAKLAALGYTRDQVAKMAPGPQKDQATAAVQGLETATFHDIGTRNAQTGAHIKARGALRQGSEGDTGVNDSKLLNMLRQGKTEASILGFAKNGIDPGDAGTVNDEAKNVKLNRATYGAYVDSFKKLNQMGLAGKLNPEKYAAEVGNFETALAKQVGPNEAHTAMASMFPSYKDWGTARQEKFDKATEHFKVNEAGTPTLDRYKLKTPFPSIPNPAGKQSGAKAAGGPTEGSTGSYKDSGGNTVKTVFKGGKWVRAQ